MSSLRPRNYHELKFLQPDKSTVKHGVLLTYSDSETRKVAPELTIQRLGKLTEFPSMGPNLKPPPHILLGAPREKDTNESNKKLIKYLAENKQRCALVYLDSKGTAGLLTCFTAEDNNRTGHSTGFRCYVIERTSSVPSLVTTGGHQASSNSSSSISGNKRGYEQLAAMEHYNENLNRDRTTRHQSQIFHMRNLNNCVKSTVIRQAVQSQPKRPLRIIDFGCGMGGDIMKWAKSCSTAGLYTFGNLSPTITPFMILEG